MNLTAKQTAHVRHALGLNEGVKQSYRNRYFATAGSEVANEWEAMCALGAAGRDDCQGCPKTTLRRYFVTPAGARAVLRAGESLCPEDFPFQGGAADA